MGPKRITCAVCKKPVEKTRWWDEYETGDLVLRVYCHGATDEMRLGMRRVSLDTLEALKHAQGEAFAGSDDASLR